MPKKGVILKDGAGDLLKARAKERGLSQESLAETLGVSDRTLRNWLAGRNGIDPASLDTLLAHLGIGIEDIFDEPPAEYRSKSKLGHIVRNLQDIVQSGEIHRVIDTYRGLIEAMASHVSFHKVSPRGPFVMIDHDGSEEKRKRYAHMVIREAAYRETARYLLSFQFFRIVRVNIGEILVTRDAVTAKPFFQKGEHRVQRSKTGEQRIDIATWFDEEGCLFFIEGTDGVQLSAEITEMLTETEMDDARDRIVVFWKGVWH